MDAFTIKAKGKDTSATNCSGSWIIVVRLYLLFIFMFTCWEKEDSYLFSRKDLSLMCLCVHETILFCSSRSQHPSFVILGRKEQKPRLYNELSSLRVLFIFFHPHSFFMQTSVPSFNLGNYARVINYSANTTREPTCSLCSVASNNSCNCNFMHNIIRIIYV